VVEAEFILELLVRLLADRARLDQGGEGTQRGAGRQVGEVELPLTPCTPLADEPSLLAGHVLVALRADALRGPVGDAHAQRRKARREPALGAAAPGDGPPRRAGEDPLGWL
jgi:hypothetical protein